METSIENYRGVLSHMCKDFNLSITLTRYSKNELTEIFGKHNRRLKGEFNYYVWDVEYEGDYFVIYTAPVKEMCISIKADIKDKKKKSIIKFIKYLENELS